MTHVIPLASMRAGFHLHSPAPSPVIHSQAFDAIKRRQPTRDHFTTKGK
ncbi:MAG: hypothetical protein PHQ58_11755 [Rhodoferax sp.]|nr:hypothetical protein [Rhodoferax sp.]MDD2881103.1 hypothetical protein [Rhodoferax sp.]